MLKCLEYLGMTVATVATFAACLFVLQHREFNLILTTLIIWIMGVLLFIGAWIQQVIALVENWIEMLKAEDEVQA